MPDSAKAPPANRAWQRRDLLWSSLWNGFLTAFVVAPWLSAGYIFGTDFAGPRHFYFPTSATSYASLQAFLAFLSLGLPAATVGKLLILGCLFVAGWSAFHAPPVNGFAPRAIASLLYVFNPFVYDRLAYGQLTVLAAYSVLPLLVVSMRKLLVEPTTLRATVIAAIGTGISLLDVHFAIAATALVALLVIARMIADKVTVAYVFRLARCLVTTAIIAATVNSYWLIPLLMGRGPEASTLAAIGDADLKAFTTASDPQWGLVPNVLALYGFWGETTGRYLSMKEFVPGWPAVTCMVLLLVVVGAVSALKVDTTDSLASGRSWVIGLLLAGGVAAILDIGVADDHVAHLINWLDTLFPPYRGMRDGAKWAGILAVVYAQLVPVGVKVLLDALRSRFRSVPANETAAPVLIAVLMATTLYGGNGLLYGLHGQIQASEYPASWYQVDRALAADSNPGLTLFLPWHGYIALSFVRNTNNVVANPAPLFFSVPVVASQDLEIPGGSPPRDRISIAVAQLVASGSQAHWASVLTSLGIKYVLLAREADAVGYSYLDQQPGLVLVRDYGSILLFRNDLWNDAA